MKKLEHLFYQEESVKQVFTFPPMVSFQSAKKLSSYLICAKFYPLERAPINVAVRDVKFATTLKRLTLSPVQLQVNHLR